MRSNPGFRLRPSVCYGSFKVEKHPKGGNDEYANHNAHAKTFGQPRMDYRADLPAAGRFFQPDERHPVRLVAGPDDLILSIYNAPFINVDLKVIDNHKEAGKHEYIF
jgi:hypothetical protein